MLQSQISKRHKGRTSAQIPKQNDFVQWLCGYTERWRAWSELQLISCRETETRKALGIKALHRRKISVLQPPCLSFPGNTDIHQLHEISLSRVKAKLLTACREMGQNQLKTYWISCIGKEWHWLPPETSQSRGGVKPSLITRCWCHLCGT